MRERLARSIADRLATVPGVVGVVLGGSVARGTADADSDVDLGIVYDEASRPDLDRLRAIAAELRPEGGAEAVTEFGAWGPWIDGGAWLSVEGHRVDWIYRGWARLRRGVEDAMEGGFTSHYQPGHPHGFHSFSDFGELRYAEVLADPTGGIGALQRRTATFPADLREAIVGRFGWEARFSLAGAGKPARRGDRLYVTGAAYRAAMCLCHVVAALNDEVLINEKRALAIVGSLPVRPAAFAERVVEALRSLDAGSDGLVAAVALLERLVGEVETLAASPSRSGTA